MESMEKEWSPPLAEASDRHTKKVKVREKQVDTSTSQDEEVNLESTEVYMEDVATNVGVMEGLSFKDKLVGSRGVSTQQKSPFDSDIDLLDQDIVIGSEDDMPTIRFSNRVKSILASKMEHSVIVKLLGKSIGYKALHSRIVALWKPMMEFQIVDLDNGYFIVHFEDPNDRLTALTKGPWTVLGHYLTVQPWSMNFNSEERYPASTVIWVRLPNMPLQYYHKSTLRAISSILGDLVKIDYQTEAVQRGKFARLAVMVNLNKPLVSRFKIDNRIQKVEYENLPTICYSCGRFGHVVESCTFFGEGVNREVETNDKRLENPVMVTESPVTGQNLGPWMHVQKRGRRMYGGGFGSGNDGRVSASRYAVLENLEEDVTNEGNPAQDIHGTEWAGKVRAGSTDAFNAETSNSKAREGGESDRDPVKNDKRASINKKNSKGGIGTGLKEVSPNKLDSKPINQEAQVDVRDLNGPDKQRVVVGLDKENHTVFVPKPYGTNRTSATLKPRGDKIESASVLHRTGINSGRPPDKRNAIVLRSRRTVCKSKAKSTSSRNKNVFPCEILDELDLERLVEVEDGVNMEDGMEEIEGNAQPLYLL